MSYQLNGRIIGWICDDCTEPLAGATLRLVRTADASRVSHQAAADPKLTATVLTEEQAHERESRRLAETVLAADGSFSVEIGSGYGGEAFEVDIY